MPPTSQTRSSVHNNACKLGALHCSCRKITLLSACAGAVCRAFLISTGAIDRPNGEIVNHCFAAARRAPGGRGDSPIVTAFASQTVGIDTEPAWRAPSRDITVFDKKRTSRSCSAVIYPSGSRLAIHDNCLKKCCKLCVCCKEVKMAAAMLTANASFLGQKLATTPKQARVANRGTVAVRAGAYDEELVKTAVSCSRLLTYSKRARLWCLFVLPGKSSHRNSGDLFS